MTAIWHWRQLYHSIHAKGENVEDVLREAEESGILEVDVAEEKLQEAYDEDVNMEGQNADSNASVTDPKVSVCFDKWNYVFCDLTNKPQVDQPIQEDVKQPAKEEPIPTTSQGPKIPAGAMPMPEPILAQGQFNATSHVHAEVRIYC